MASETRACTDRMMITPITAISPYSCREACEFGSLVPVNTANRMMMNAAISVWTTDAMYGLLNLGWVRPSGLGSSPSRPREYMYRAVVLWNAIPQANDPVMIR